MTTVARPIPVTGAHYYDPTTGEPRHFVKKKDGSGDRPSTIKDCRDNGWVPSCTTVLKLLHKEALVQWQIEQGILSAVTTPRLPNETDDAFVYRIVHVDKTAEQEGQIARDKGTAIHAALEAYFSGQPVPPEMEQTVRPVIDALISRGEMASSEVVLVGAGYAGRTDLIQDCEGCWHLTDFKSARKLPDPNKGGAYLEHKVQCAAYAKAFADKLKRAGELKKPIVTSNVYISTSNPGEFVICEHEESWEETYENGFHNLLSYWVFQNGYTPPGFEPKRFFAPPASVIPAPAAPAPVAPTPAPAVEPIPIPRLSPGQTPPPSLPSKIGGKKVVWSTGVVVPSNSQPK